MGKWDSLLGMYPGPRGAYLAEQVATNPRVRAALEAAEMTGTENRVLAEVAGQFEVPSAPRRAVEVPMPGRPRTDEQIVRDSVGEELGPFYREAPAQQVDDAFERLGRTEGGEDLVGRLEASGPRPLYSFDLSPAARDQQMIAGRNFHLFPGPRFPDGELTALAGDMPVGGGYRAEFGPGDAGPPALGSGGWGSGSSRDLIPAGFGGEGVPVGGPRGSGTVVPESRELSTFVRPRPALEGPIPRRIETTAPGPVVRRLEAPGVAEERAAMQALEDAVNADNGRLNPARLRRGQAASSQSQSAAGGRGGRGGGSGPPPGSPPPRGQSPSGQPAGRGKRALAAAAAGAAGVGTGIYLMTPPRGKTAATPDAAPTGASTADLAAEQSPPPAVMTQEPEEIDYSAMAREKIRQANEIQLREGRITPESAKLTREADALYQRAADQRRQGGGKPIMPSEQSNAQTSAVRAMGQRQVRDNPGEDYHSQARRLMGRMNAGEFRSPAEYAAAKQEVNRLFALGDEQRNARR